ncbi:hypothetical protein PR048_006120 [Dryococelus australis]|uniref:Uncharacterized protein n=1 Tax=Dryococelus australis TaxID=614101 RepID=A0ABQ9IA31_9NEOP|nr:hypothetical protein PR048_006120 [Dryococelus australis]
MMPKDEKDDSLLLSPYTIFPPQPTQAEVVQEVLRKFPQSLITSGGEGRENLLDQGSASFGGRGNGGVEGRSCVRGWSDCKRGGEEFSSVGNSWCWREVACGALPRCGQLGNQKVNLTSAETMVRGSGGTVVKALASNHRDPGSIPGGLTPGFSNVGTVLDDTACRRATPASSALAFQRRSILGSHFIAAHDMFTQTGVRHGKTARAFSWKVRRLHPSSSARPHANWETWPLFRAAIKKVHRGTQFQPTLSKIDMSVNDHMRIRIGRDPSVIIETQSERKLTTEKAPKAGELKEPKDGNTKKLKFTMMNATVYCESIFNVLSSISSCSSTVVIRVQTKPIGASLKDVRSSFLSLPRHPITTKLSTKQSLAGLAATRGLGGGGSFILRLRLTYEVEARVAAFSKKVFSLEGVHGLLVGITGHNGDKSLRRPCRSTLVRGVSERG